MVTTGDQTTMTRLTMTGILAFCALGCGADRADFDLDSEPISQTADEVINGATTRDTGAVAIYWGGTRPCSGVLIHPRRVLTARHCVTDGDFLMRTDPLLPVARLLVTSELSPGPTPPPAFLRRAGYWSTVFSIYDRDTHPTGADSRMDLAILNLKNDLKDSVGNPLRPATLYNGTLDSLLNQRIAAVGYGRYTVGTDTGSGVQRRMTTSVLDLTSGVDGGGYRYNFSIGRGVNGLLPTMVDHGDSGGPWFRETTSGLALAGIAQSSNRCCSMATEASATALTPGVRGGDWLRSFF